MGGEAAIPFAWLISLAAMAWLVLRSINPASRPFALPTLVLSLLVSLAVAAGVHMSGAYWLSALAWFTPVVLVLGVQAHVIKAWLLHRHRVSWTATGIAPERDVVGGNYALHDAAGMAIDRPTPAQMHARLRSMAENGERCAATSLRHESGWSVSAFPSGRVMLQNEKDGRGPWHMEGLDPEGMLSVWQTLVAGRLAHLKALQWANGAGD